MFGREKGIVVAFWRRRLITLAHAYWLCSTDSTNYGATLDHVPKAVFSSSTSENTALVSTLIAKFYQK